MDFPDQDDLETGENVNNPDLEAFDAFNDVRAHLMFSRILNFLFVIFFFRKTVSFS